MKHTAILLCAALLAAGARPSPGQVIQIKHVGAGTIEWTSETNAVYRLEWTSRLIGTNTEWSTDWTHFAEIPGTGATTRAKIPAFCRIVRFVKHNDLTNIEAWRAYDAAGTSGLDTRGFAGAIFDGRYVYAVPYWDDNEWHARVLRYDTKNSFTNGSSWVAHDAAGTGSLNTKGYYGGVYDGRYIYFAPHENSSGRHGIALRYDTESAFTNEEGWVAYDAGNTDGLNTKGYMGAAYDGRYIYYCPDRYGSTEDTFHARVLRYDTTGSGFTNSSSWAAYDASNTSGMDTRAYEGMVFDGRHLYFAPRGWTGATHGRVLRYDTEGDFRAGTNWVAYDAGNTDGMETGGYRGAVYTGRYIYFVPARGISPIMHGRVLRYDTEGVFTNTTSWAAYDAGATSGLNTRGYAGGTFDGRYVYFSPNWDETATPHGRVLRYDTAHPFKTPASWTAYDAGNTDAMTTKGYIATAYDGRFVYFVPWRSAFSTYHGRILRFDTKWPAAMPDTISGGSCF